MGLTKSSAAERRGAVSEGGGHEGEIALVGGDVNGPMLPARVGELAFGQEQRSQDAALSVSHVVEGVRARLRGEGGSVPSAAQWPSPVTWL